MRKRYVPARGDVVWIDLKPQAGHEQSGRRPALVLTPERYNRLAHLAIVCPITSNSKGYPFEVRIPPGHAVTGVVLADHAKSLDWDTRNAELTCTLPEATVEEVFQKLATLLKG